jgi:SAM-dependent methyltransferase
MDQGPGKRAGMNCPLCHSSDAFLFDQDKLRRYLQCQSCSLVWVPREELIPLAEEHQRYEAHQNLEEDADYKFYLKKIRDEVLPYLQSHLEGLDFGCGKTELLSQLFSEVNIPVKSYDIFFLPDEFIWDQTYDFIILSEVIEHLRHPREIMERLRTCLRPGGQIFLKTKFYPAEFKNWFYKRDKTHVQFFSESSMGELTKILKMDRVEFLPQDLTRLILE